MQPDATTVEQSLLAISFLSTPSIVTGLKAEVPEYIAGNALPNWACAAKKALLLQPSSVAVERVFSMLKCSFGELQENSIQDYVESSLMLQHEKH